jgi:hypothetical protein
MQATVHFAMDAVRGALVGAHEFNSESSAAHCFRAVSGLPVCDPRSLPADADPGAR